MDELKSAELWWHNLPESSKQELINDCYSNESMFIDVDEMWNGLTNEQKIDVWKSICH